MENFLGWNVSIHISAIVLVLALLIFEITADYIGSRQDESRSWFRAFVAIVCIVALIVYAVATLVLGVVAWKTHEFSYIAFAVLGVCFFFQKCLFCKH